MESQTTEKCNLHNMATTSTQPELTHQILFILTDTDCQLCPNLHLAQHCHSLPIQDVSPCHIITLSSTCSLCPPFLTSLQPFCCHEIFLFTISHVSANDSCILLVFFVSRVSFKMKSDRFISYNTMLSVLANLFAHQHSGRQWMGEVVTIALSGTFPGIHVRL